MARVFITDHAREQYARRFTQDFLKQGKNVDSRLIDLVLNGYKIKRHAKGRGVLLRNGRFIFATHKKRYGIVVATVMRAANDE